MTVSQWSDRHRVLDAKYCAEPGQWRTDRVPYSREIMDSFTDHGVSQIMLVSSARTSKTEQFYNMLSYAIDQEPGPAIIALPTQPAVQEEFRTRIKDSILASPQLRGHVPASGDWATADCITLDSMLIYAAYAASPVTLTRRTARYVFFDELDNCEKAAGHLGSHLALAEERHTTFGYRGKLVAVTTPSVESAAGWRTLLDSDHRRYHVPCPLCGGYQVLAFDRIRVPEDVRDPNVIETTQCAWYECEHCHGAIPQAERSAMVSRGLWVPRGVTVDQARPAGVPDSWRPRTVGGRPKTRRIGFHIWSAYSPWRTWSDIVAKFFRVKDSAEDLRVFTNSWLGEPFRETSERIEVDDLRDRIVGAPPPAVVPDEAVMLMMGVDVQQNWLYYVVRAFGPQGRSWLINYGMVSDLEAAYRVALTRYPRASSRSGDTIGPELMAVDTGHKNLEVYDFARTHRGVVPVKGQTTDAAFSLKPSRITYTPKGTVAVHAVDLWLINVNHFKEWIMYAMRVPVDGPRGWGLHSKTGDDYLRQVTSERQVWATVKRGRIKRRQLIWEPKTEGAANHWWDCEVYLTAMAEYKGLLMIQPGQPEQPESPTPGASVEAPPESPDKPRFGRGPLRRSPS